MASMASRPRRTRLSCGKGGTPSEPLGRRFHHMMPHGNGKQDDAETRCQQYDLVGEAELLAHMDVDPPFQRLSKRTVIGIAHVDERLAAILIEMDDTLL